MTFLSHLMTLPLLFSTMSTNLIFMTLSRYFHWTGLTHNTHFMILRDLQIYFCRLSYVRIGCCLIQRFSDNILDDFHMIFFFFLRSDFPIMVLTRLSVTSELGD